MLNDPDVIIMDEPTRGIGMCDRIYVMCKGEIVCELARSEFSQEAIMRLATGIERKGGGVVNEIGKARATWSTITRNYSIYKVFAILIICGLLDLSSGSVLALSGLLSVACYKSTGSMELAFLASIGVAMACNLVSALMVTRFAAPSFIARLAMQEMARGSALLFTKGQSIYQIGDYTIVGQGSVGFIPIPVLSLVGLFFLTWYLLKQTRFGRSLYAIGAINYEFQGLTSSIIGGSSFSGGIGTVVGVFIVGFLNNIMNLANVNSYMQQIARRHHRAGRDLRHLDQEPVDQDPRARGLQIGALQRAPARA
jgi:ABC-type xylose transport system permease subunit